ncbi:MAG: YbjN domain-containing protein [Pseudomonadota bacterium]
MKIFVRAAGLSLAIASGSSAIADEASIVPADPWEIIHVARALGPAEVKRDAFNDPQIVGNVPEREGEAPGLNYTIEFYGCDLGRDCETILFVARIAKPAWAKDAPQADLFTDWNGEKLIGRARLDELNQAVLEHPVPMRAGLPKETLLQTFELWQIALREFAEHVESEGE